MQRSLAYKLGTLVLLSLILLIPLSMIEGLVSQRQSQRDQVVQDIARSSSQAQQLTGPLLVIPYSRKVRHWVSQKDSNQRFLEERIETGRLYFLPERFLLDGRLSSELRSRGIYQSRLYQSRQHISGHFQLPSRLGISGDLADYQFEAPFISVGISDIRGIGNAPRLQLNGREIDFQPGAGDPLPGSGVHAVLPELDVSQGQRLEFAFDLQLQGSGSLAITPVGRESRVSLQSDWPHPSFFGDYLPAERTVQEQGFSARWQTSFFATSLEEVLASCSAGRECQALQARQLGVSLIDPVDQYLKSERAIKYALLFVALTFAGVFLCEVLRRLSVHPLQYLLVGMALALFYLLLLSLAEHLPFALAYLLAASACVSLLGVYAASMLRSLRHGALFAAALAALYAMLYAVLGAEDYALLMGSLLVFGVLAAFMLLTRHIDWYSVGRPAVSAGTGTAAEHA